MYYKVVRVYRNWKEPIKRVWVCARLTIRKESEKESLSENRIFYMDLQVKTEFDNIFFFFFFIFIALFCSYSVSLAFARYDLLSFLLAICLSFTALYQRIFNIVNWKWMFFFAVCCCFCFYFESNVLVSELYF